MTGRVTRRVAVTLIVAAVIMLALAGYSRVQAAEKPDVVFIAIEDFSPQMTWPTRPWAAPTQIRRG